MSQTIIMLSFLSSIEKRLFSADKIYVVDDGKIIDSGNHEKLLINSKVYKNFYERQIKES